MVERGGTPVPHCNCETDLNQLDENGIMISVRMEYEFYLGQMFSEGF